MILKLRTGIDEHLSWRIIDYVDQIDYRYIDEPKEFGPNDNYVNVFPNVKNKRIVEIAILHRGGLRTIMWTDDIVYILNNEGKTCDTINI